MFSLITKTIEVYPIDYNNAVITTDLLVKKVVTTRFLGIPLYKVITKLTNKHTINKKNQLDGEFGKSVNYRFIMGMIKILIYN